MFLGLRRKTVTHALELYYKPTELQKTREMIVKIQGVSANRELLQKMQLKITMMEFNNKMIQMILERLQEDKKKFIYYRYNKCMNLIAIAMKLYVTVSQLQRWESEVLDIVEHFIYSYYSEQILSTDQLNLMIQSLQDKISILERDDYTILVDSVYLQQLKEKHQFFTNLLQKIEDYLQQISKEEKLILEERLLNCKLPLKHIAEKYRISNASVSVYVNKFKKYVEENVRINHQHVSGA